MESLLQIIAPVLLFASSLFGFGGQAVVTDAPVRVENNSVELGLYEVSPKGEAGGFAMPASGCGMVHNGRPVHSCATAAPDINVDKPIVRLGDPVTVTWTPRISINCVLSSNVMALRSSPNPSTAPNGNAAGSRIDSPTGETTYTITCQDTGNSDSVIVKVLPRIQET